MGEMPTHVSLLAVFEEMVRLREENMVLRAQLEHADRPVMDVLGKMRGKWVPFEVKRGDLLLAKEAGRSAVYRCVRDAALASVAGHSAIALVDMGRIDGNHLTGHVWVAEAPK